MKVFKIGEPIRFGVKYTSGLGSSKPNTKDFESSYASLVDPTKETEIDGEFIDDDPFYWTPIFYLFSAGMYVIHIVNNKAGINVKETFKIEGSLYEANDSDIIF